MKIRLPLVSLLCALLAVPALFAQEGEMKKKMGPKEPGTPLSEQMEKIGGAYRKLGNLVKDPTKNADALAQVAIIKEAAAAAAKFEPAKKNDLPAADQAKFVADFQSELKVFTALVGKLEAALKANDNAAAQKLVDELKEQRNKDHKQFEKKKEKKKES
jgi:soluble cytochrome b562